jgi:hypothetical protein
MYELRKHLVFSNSNPLSYYDCYLAHSQMVNPKAAAASKTSATIRTAGMADTIAQFSAVHPDEGRNVAGLHGSFTTG